MSQGWHMLKEAVRWLTVLWVTRCWSCTVKCTVSEAALLALSRNSTFSSKTGSARPLTDGGALVWPHTCTSTFLHAQQGILVHHWGLTIDMSIVQCRGVCHQLYLHLL